MLRLGRNYEVFICITYTDGWLLHEFFLFKNTSGSDELKRSDKKSRLWVVVENSIFWKITSVKTSSCHSVEIEVYTAVMFLDF